VDPGDEQRNEGGKHEYAACLRLISETLTLAEITAVLGPPTESRDIGEPVSQRPGAAKSKHSFWSLCAEVEGTRPLDEHVEQVVELAEGHAAGLSQLRPHCRVIDITCSVHAEPFAEGGWEFTPDLMRRVAELDLVLTAFLS
jgi:hypothetical protein